MKKIIVILVFALSIIGCQKEICKTCTTSILYQGKSYVYETTQCGGYLEKEDGETIIVTDLIGNITYVKFTTCK